MLLQVHFARSILSNTSFPSPYRPRCIIRAISFKNRTLRGGEYVCIDRMMGIHTSMYTSPLRQSTFGWPKTDEGVEL